ncbi:hypothetical protein SELMODRAFT_227430 [Selaginella moellendorffii]|uniref:SNARE-complex protein Syntaxin-18 N-terminal domain-containing protein n=1 Tax=Selaginella moellendorffii TaxID=88036 RepID=D8QYP6_SELML|nr:syntaxin-81 [Selaginella moellendorffii]EFJ34277.1 hypothetical protein SELMODRAFT_227430 [Selaginella moellendorffii]|eukprot:XP_002963944.1 syntaxin-81 [Selaginella moellendorffii]
MALARRDRTEAFRDAVRAAAASIPQCDEVKIASSLIMHRTLELLPFTAAALEILGHIRTMESFILERRKDYLDRQRCTEEERDNIEHEVGLSVKACKQRIDDLKNSIAGGKKLFWKGAVNADLNAHQHGIVLMLSEKLHAVTTIFDALRASRFQKALDKTLPKRRPHLQSATAQLEAELSNRTAAATSFNRENLQELQPSQAQIVLDSETRALQEELSNLLDTAEDTERKMLEVSALNHLFSSYVFQQSQQIELLYQQAVEATENVNKGNKELRKTIERNTSSRTFLLMFLTILPLSLLFLDWYNG